jgi:energy-coupling factor transporter ATP-binding protein EcfA2
MAAFPILSSLEVRNYGLYPSADKNGIFTLNFAQGLTLILGANGLGKSTLIAMLFRMLTGPFDLALPSGSIGTSELKATALNRHLRLAFGARVNDAARQATATLNFVLGTRQYSVTRSLSDLSLLSFESGGSPSADEVGFQRAILVDANLATFGEWILVLRTLVFFFEDRRTLVWDPSAQRQLLRCLLLPPEEASRWAVAERDILELDTRMRNLQAALRREQRDFTEVQQRVQASPGVTAALRAAEATADRLRERQDVLSESVELADQSRHRHRLDAFRAQEQHDAAIQELERARLTSVESRFPSADASMRYILARLMSDGSCLVCGTPEQEIKREELIAAIDHRRCVICNSPVHESVKAAVDLGDERIDSMRLKVEVTLKTMRAAQHLLEESTRVYEATTKELAQCAADLSGVRDQLNALVNQLPPEEQLARRQHDDLRALEGRVNSLRVTIKEKREAFITEMVKHRDSILRFATSIKSAFEAAAQGFLFEDGTLSWSPIRTQVGQAGAEGVDPIEYPAFAVELSGGDFTAVVRRDGPDQVSESQREFIDLAFRMALIHVAASNQAGSIVIDAPESSLDAVFVDRAAFVLARFANANGMNRLIATSNLAAGALIPALLIAAERDSRLRAGRIVDLFAAGVPTRAMMRHADAYARYKAELYRQIESSDASG